MNRRNFLSISKLSLVGSSLLLSNSLIGSNTEKSFFIRTIKPPALQKGDTIGIVSPASAVFKSDAITNFSNLLQNIGYKVKIGKYVDSQFGYLAGTDEQRAEDINNMFADNSVKAIIAMRGGWGAARILSLIDYELIRKNPKIIVGFSDITSLLNAIFVKTGLITFHGPVGYTSWSDFTLQYFEEIVTSGQKSKLKVNKDSSSDFLVINNGRAKGRLIGGNLSVLTSLIGSSYLTDFENQILFLEEVNEEVYRIDRMMTQLKLSGALNKISGFVFGICQKCEPEEPEHSLSLHDVLKHHIKPLGIPAFYGTHIGHITDKFTIPIGLNCEIIAETGTIRFLEAPVINR